MVDNSIIDYNSTDYVLFKKSYGNNDPKVIITNTLLVDENNNWCNTNKVKVNPSESSARLYSVEFDLDSNFTKHDNVRYPITLNQSFYVYKAKQPDLPVYSDTGSETGFYLSPYMMLGNTTGKGEGWGFIRFEVLEKLRFDKDKIISAKYHLYNLFDLTEPVKISAYAITEDWCSVNTKWFSKPSYNTNAISSIYIKERGEYSLDITSLFKLMMEDTLDKEQIYSVRNSFLIKCENQNANVIIPSGDNGLFSPVLEIIIDERK